MATYHANGSVRGSCGHQHKSAAAAERCRQRDADACGRLGGGAYSDRKVERLDGRPLSQSEMAEIEAVQSERDGW